MRPPRHVDLGPGREFDAVRSMLARWGPIAQGIGDDAALLDVPPGEKLVLSTDTSVDEVHFRRSWLSAEEIGWRAATAALSDLAAMGATPMGVLFAVTVPDEWRESLDSIAAGFGDACASVKAPILGGDVTRGERLSLGVTVVGRAVRPLTRDGARNGNTLYVTGSLGGPLAALRAWEDGEEPASEARHRFAHPEARIRAGEWVAERGALACIDLSDGLVGDAAHLAAASGVRVVIDLDQVPCFDGVSAEHAMASGEEFELLVAAPTLDAVAFARATGGLKLTAIGRIEDSTRGVGEVVAHRGGRVVALPGTHDHFAER